MHCHLILSRKDQANKKKLSPLTNHRNTKNGIIKGGFDRKNLFQQVEQGFDRLFGYKRKLAESFEYYNTIKKGSISDQLKMQEQQIVCTELRPSNQLNVGTMIQLDISTLQQSHNKYLYINVSDLGLSSAADLLTPDVNKEAEQTFVKRRKKKPKRGFKR